MDHHGLTGRGRDFFREVGRRDGDTFHPREFASEKSDTYDHGFVTYGLAQSRVFWQSLLVADNATDPRSGERVVDTEEPPSSFLVAAPGFVTRQGYAGLLRNMDVDQDLRYGDMEMVGYDEEDPNPITGHTPSTRSREPLKGAHDVGTEQMGGKLLANPLPDGSPVVWIAGMERASSHPLGFAGWTNLLIADYEGENALRGTHSTRIADMYPGETEADPEHTAPLGATHRVVRTINGQAQLAWNGAPSKTSGGLSGRAPMVSGEALRPYSAPQNDEITNVVLPDQAQIGSVTRVDAAIRSVERETTEPYPSASSGDSIGYMADTNGGPLSNGAGLHDKHFYGLDSEGRAHVQGHINGQAPYYVNQFMDAVIEHSGIYQDTIGAGGFRVPVAFAYDPASSHTGTGGPNMDRRTFPGLHRFFSYSPWLPAFDDPPPLPPLPPEDEPPPPPEELVYIKPESTTPELEEELGNDPNILFPWFSQGPVNPLISSEHYKPDQFEGLDSSWGGVRVLEQPIETPLFEGVQGNGAWTPEKREEIERCRRKFDKPGTEIVTDTEVSGVDTYVRAANMVAHSGLLAAPPKLNDEGDYRFSRNPSLCEAAEVACTPVAAQLVPFGKVDDSGDYVYATNPGNDSQFRNGTIGGGFAVMPPTESIDGRASAPNGVTPDDTFFAIKQPNSGAQVKLGFGCPKQSGDAAGKIQDGFVLARNGDTWELNRTDELGSESSTPSLELNEEFVRPVSLKRLYELFTATALDNEIDAVPGVSYTVDTSVSAVAVNLPEASGYEGERIVIIDTGNAATDEITVKRAGSDTIMGAISHTMETDYETVVLEATSYGWAIV